jgi:hypothetical protein
MESKMADLTYYISAHINCKMPNCHDSKKKDSDEIKKSKIQLYAAWRNSCLKTKIGSP